MRQERKTAYLLCSYTACVITLVASQAGASSITWNVSGGGDWDTSTTNWIGDATTFTDDGTVDVTFDKSAGGTIAIASNMSPQSMTVSASLGTYTFTGGPIDSGTLTKSGGGTLDLTSSSAHTFTGKTVIAGGQITVRSNVYAGAASALGSPTGTEATIDMYPGTTLRNIGPGGRDNRSKYWTIDRTINLASAGLGTITLQNGWNDEWASFSAITATGTGPRTLRLAPSGDRARIRVTGPIADTADDAVSLQVSFTSQATANGHLYLSGTNTFSGPIDAPGSSRTYYIIIDGSGSLGSGNYTNTISIGSNITLEYASSADQTVAGAISGDGSLRVSGTGTVTLAGINTYGGATSVGAGTLVAVAGGSCSNSDVTVSAGALRVSITNNTKQWTCQSLTYSTTDTLEFAFGGTTPSTNVAALNVNGDIELADASPALSCTGAGLSGLPSGAYPLIKWAGTMTGPVPSLTLPSGSGNLIRDDANKTLWLNITSSKQPLTWQGGGDSVWVANEPEYTKWQDADGVGVNYRELAIGDGVLGESVVFSNAAGGAVMLNSIVYPASVVLSGSNDYTIAGSGGIAGGGSLTKNGTSTQALATANTYAGQTAVNAGTLQGTVDGAMGAGQVTIAGGATLHLTHSNAVAGTAGITLAASDSSLLCESDITISNLTFGFRANYTFSGAHGLHFLPGGTIANADNRDWITITNLITGSPEVLIKDYGVGNQYKGLIFAPDSGSQTLGDIINPIDRTPNGPDKAGVTLGGSTTGNSATRIYYEGGNQYGDVNKSDTGTWTVAGDITTGTYRHHLGTLICNGRIKAHYFGFFFTAGTLAGNCTLTRNDRRGNISFPSAFVVAPGTSSPGTMTVAWGSSGNPTANQQWVQFLDGSIIEWDVGVSSNDVIHVVDGKVDLDNFVLRIMDAGGRPAVKDQLPVFTYETGVTIDMTGFSNTVANFDTTAVSDWAGGPLSLTDNGVDTIYLTGLNAPPEGTMLIVK